MKTTKKKKNERDAYLGISQMLLSIQELCDSLIAQQAGFDGSICYLVPVLM